jgi:hypothetical protein
MGDQDFPRCEYCEAFIDRRFPHQCDSAPLRATIADLRAEVVRLTLAWHDDEAHGMQQEARLAGLLAAAERELAEWREAGQGYSDAFRAWFGSGSTMPAADIDTSSEKWLALDRARDRLCVDVAMKLCPAAESAEKDR